MTEQKKTIDWRIVAVGLMCLTGLEVYALSQGINGTLFTIIIAMIGLAIGVTIENPFKIK